MPSRDLPRYAAVDEVNAADQSGPWASAVLICSIPLIHRPGSARPQVAVRRVDLLVHRNRSV